jgi:hypothetical protein
MAAFKNLILNKVQGAHNLAILHRTCCAGAGQIFHGPFLCFSATPAQNGPFQICHEWRR